MQREKMILQTPLSPLIMEPRFHTHSGRGSFDGSINSAVGFPLCFTDGNKIRVKQSNLFTPPLQIIVSSFESLQLSAQQASSTLIMVNSQVRGHQVTALQRLDRRKKHRSDCANDQLFIKTMKETNIVLNGSVPLCQI